MRKKIALVLVMVMLVNSVTWAAEKDDDDFAGTMIVIGSVLLIVGLMLLPSILAEADAPDDGIRLASLSNENPIPGSGFGSFLKALNYVEIGQPQNDKIYLGLRFRF